MMNIELNHISIKPPEEKTVSLFYSGKGENLEVVTAFLSQNYWIKVQGGKEAGCLPKTFVPIYWAELPKA